MRARQIVLPALLIGIAAASPALRRLLQPPCPPWLAWWLESPLADRLAGTTATLDQIGLRPGQQVLEIGPGPGRLLIPASRRVLPGGTVTGLELQPAMAARLRRRAERAGATNLSVVQGDAAAPPFPPASFDVIVLCTVLGEITDRTAALAHCRNLLRPGGVLSITELRPDPHYLPLATVRDLAESAGFRLVRLHQTLGRYTAIFTPA
ncbi:MAG: class I SAM-dependent methyltransferase [Chloroflexi bacterium]|nr:class I SAM-dependent methyltransferase [Chloroflexota bacterium]